MLQGIGAFIAGDWEAGICTINLCPMRDIGVPTSAKTDTFCGVGVPVWKCLVCE
jgi:hypothetical protein